MRHDADASLLVPLFTIEAITLRARAWMDATSRSLFVSDLAGAGFASAMARKRRTQLLTKEEAAAAFDRWATTHAPPCRAVHEDVLTATAWLRRADLTLRAPDASDLAITRRPGVPVVTFDAGMTTAARVPSVPVAEA